MKLSPDQNLTANELHALLDYFVAENEQLHQIVADYRSLTDSNLAMIRQLLDAKTHPNTKRKPR